MIQIVEHMGTALVLWGWHPGEGRTAIPMPQHEFLATLKAWAAREPPALKKRGVSSSSLPGRGSRL